MAGSFQLVDRNRPPAKYIIFPWKKYIYLASCDFGVKKIQKERRRIKESEKLRLQFIVLFELAAPTCLGTPLPGARI